MTWRSTDIAGATLADGASREVLLGTTSVLLIRSQGRLHALDAICPHLGGLLADGLLEGERLTCPEHAAAFDVRDGHVLADPFGIEPPLDGVGPLTAFAVRVEAGTIEVDLPDR